MGIGIIVCGLNGCGKSTLGKALAEKLCFPFIDVEDLYFPKTDPRNPYADPRGRAEVEQLLLRELQAHENFVFSSVKGDYGDAVCAHFQYAVLLEVPREIRLQRVENRSFKRFGNRMLPGGDLYEQEQHFFDFVRSRDENTVEEWIRSLRCHVLRIDGTNPITENVDLILRQLPLPTYK